MGDIIIMFRTHTLKEFQYKGKKYKFIEPLTIRIDNYLCHDLKTMAGELSIPSIPDGYSKLEPIEDHKKEITTYLKHIFNDYLFKDNSELDEDELKYKKKWISLLKPPKQKS
jgi:hypothetical protein